MVHITPAAIRAALEKARKGILQYSELMRLLPAVDVSRDADFQRKYNAFYRVQRRQEVWYRSYYALMQQQKGRPAIFHDVLDEIFKVTGRYEPSFASKLVATINPSKPIWDIHVLANTGCRAPSYSNKNKLALAKEAYSAIENWYSKFLLSADGELCVKEFDQLVSNHWEFTAVKKVDFILWQIRPTNS